MQCYDSSQTWNLQNKSKPQIQVQPQVLLQIRAANVTVQVTRATFCAIDHLFEDMVNLALGGCNNSTVSVSVAINGVNNNKQGQAGQATVAISEQQDG